MPPIVSHLSAATDERHPPPPTVSVQVYCGLMRCLPHCAQQSYYPCNAKHPGLMGARRTEHLKSVARSSRAAMHSRLRMPVQTQRGPHDSDADTTPRKRHEVSMKPCSDIGLPPSRMEPRTAPQDCPVILPGVHRILQNPDPLPKHDASPTRQTSRVPTTPTPSSTFCARNNRF